MLLIRPGPGQVRPQGLGSVAPGDPGRHIGVVRPASAAVERLLSKRVLVFGDDTKAFLAVVRSLGRRGAEVHVAPSDFATAALKSRYVAAVHRLPAYLLSPERWTEALRELIGREAIDVVVPTSDKSLLMLLRHAGELGRERLALPSEQAARIFTDKAATRRLAFAAGVPVCPGRVLTPGDQAGDLTDAFGLPLVLKPARSWSPGDVAGKREARIVRSEAALAEALAEGLDGEWVVEGFFAGVGVGVSVIASEGEILAAVQHRRLQQETETGPSTCRVTEELTPRLIAWTRDLARAARLTGVAMFEYRWNPGENAYVLLEVNPRFWGSLPLALAAGADFPAMVVDLHSGTPPAPAFNYPAGCAKIDLWGEYCRLRDTVDEARSPLRRTAAAVHALAQLARLARPAAFDSWAEDDPEPFRAERKAVLDRLAEAALKRVPQPALLRAHKFRNHIRRLLSRPAGEPVRLLVVDDDNCSRSVFAEQLLRSRLNGRGASVEVVSAGTVPIEDRPPPAEAMAAAARFGVDLSRHRSRSLTAAGLMSATAVIVFDHETARRLRSIEPSVEAAVVRLPDVTDAGDVARSGELGLVADFRRISDSVSAFAGELLNFLPVR